MAWDGDVSIGDLVAGVDQDGLLFIGYDDREFGELVRITISDVEAFGLCRALEQLLQDRDRSTPESGFYAGEDFYVDEEEAPF